MTTTSHDDDDDDDDDDDLVSLSPSSRSARDAWNQTPSFVSCRHDARERDVVVTRTMAFLFPCVLASPWCARLRASRAREGTWGGRMIWF